MTISEDVLARVRVRDVMHTGILTTDPTTPLRVVARLMADQRVHAVAVADPEYARRPWGFVTTLEVVNAVAEGSDEIAGEVAETGVLTVPSDQTLSAAAQLMADNRVTHLIVIDPSTGHPCGILSSLDVAAAYAGVIDVLANPDPFTGGTAANEQLREEADRLRTEAQRLRAENRELRAALDAYVARVGSAALFGPCEMTAGTSVGPRRHRDLEPEVILICYDQSVDAKAAIKEAGSLFEGEPATVLTVWHTLSRALRRSAAGPRPLAGAGEIDETDRANLYLATRRAVEGAELARLGGIDAEPRTVAQKTTVAQAILDEALMLDASAIVLGSRGRGRLKSLLLGSVAEAVVEHADRPVIVVPSPVVARARRRHPRAHQATDERAMR